MNTENRLETMAQGTGLGTRKRVVEEFKPDSTAKKKVDDLLDKIDYEKIGVENNRLSSAYSTAQRSIEGVFEKASSEKEIMGALMQFYSAWQKLGPGISYDKDTRLREELKGMLDQIFRQEGDRGEFDGYRRAIELVQQGNSDQVLQQLHNASKGRYMQEFMKNLVHEHAGEDIDANLDLKKQYTVGLMSRKPDKYTAGDIGTEMDNFYRNILSEVDEKFKSKAKRTAKGLENKVKYDAATNPGMN